MAVNTLRIGQEELDALQARIKASSTVRTVRHLQTEHESARGEKQAALARRRKRKEKLPKLPEKTVLRDCSRILDEHPRVAFWWRNNVGAMKMDNGRFIKFSFVGASDLMAVSAKGRFIAVECKATGKMPTDEQRAFLSNVSDAGGLACCVDHPGKLALALSAL